MNGDQTSSSGRQYNPGDNPPSLTEPSSPLPTLPPVQPEPPATVSESPIEPHAVQPQPAPVAARDEAADGFYRPDPVQPASFISPELAGDANAGGADSEQDAGVISWTSSGDALRARSSTWRVKMTLASLVLAGLIYLLIRDAVSAVLVGVAGVLFGFMGASKPQGLSYRLDYRGITIGKKRYAYSEFRAFSIPDEPNSPTINLMPLKRFLPILSIHFDPAQRDRILDVLAVHLPMEAHRRDAFDQIAHKVRF